MWVALLKEKEIITIVPIEDLPNYDSTECQVLPVIREDATRVWGKRKTHRNAILDEEKGVVYWRPIYRDWTPEEREEYEEADMRTFRASTWQNAKYNILDEITNLRKHMDSLEARITKLEV